MPFLYAQLASSLCLQVVKWLSKMVKHFPTDSECIRYMSSVTDRDLLKRCHVCAESIATAKERQGQQADKVMSALLEELDKEKVWRSTFLYMKNSDIFRYFVSRLAKSNVERRLLESERSVRKSVKNVRRPQSPMNLRHQTARRNGRCIPGMDLTPE